MQLRLALEEEKRAGRPFDEAWERALASVRYYDTRHRGEWEGPLLSSRAEYRACYEGRMTPTGRFFRDFPPALLAREGNEVLGMEVAAA